MTDDRRRIRPVILSGGSGTRLWPLSRIGRPKQLIGLTGEESMLQLTARRMADPASFDPPIVVASGEHADAIDAQMAAAGVPPALLILEPSARNTAPAIALAALNSAPGDLLLVSPSDHSVTDTAAFLAAVHVAAAHGQSGALVTFGIKAERPETGYGYIERGAPLGDGAFRVQAFAEKPDLDTARSYCADGRHDWNSGIFLFTAGAYLAALEELAPAIAEAARNAVASQRRQGIRIRPDAASFAQAPSAPVDRAVMEKAEGIVVVPVDMGWSDIGSWDALHALGPRDEAGNVLQGDAAAVDSSGCMVRSDGPMVVTLGVHDLVVVATERAVLVMPRSESQRVGEALDALRERGLEQKG